MLVMSRAFVLLLDLAGFRTLNSVRRIVYLALSQLVHIFSALIIHQYICYVHPFLTGNNRFMIDESLTVVNRTTWH